MQVNGAFICLGVDWSNFDQPALRLGGREMDGKSFLLPLRDEVLSFRVIEPQTRYCLGWFDLKGAAPRHITCRTWQEVSAGKQCQDCQRLEGFQAVHQAHRYPDRLRDDVRRYLMQTHYLYVAVFAGGDVKVGTVAESRKLTRLAEQGAVAAYYVAQTDDGFLVRRAEEMVSTTLGLKQALSSSRKLKALYDRVEDTRLVNELTVLAHEVGSVIDRLEVAHRLSRPVLWRCPPSARDVLDATPVYPYGFSLKEGEHLLRTKGVIGSILAFDSNVDPESPSYAVGLSDLTGREIDFGDYRGQQQFTQTKLF